MHFQNKARDNHSSKEKAQPRKLKFFENYKKIINYLIILNRIINKRVLKLFKKKLM